MPAQSVAPEPVAAVTALATTGTGFTEAPEDEEDEDEEASEPVDTLWTALERSSGYPDHLRLILGCRIPEQILYAYEQAGARQGPARPVKLIAALLDVMGREEEARRLLDTPHAHQQGPATEAESPLAGEDWKARYDAIVAQMRLNEEAAISTQMSARAEAADALRAKQAEMVARVEAERRATAAEANALSAHDTLVATTQTATESVQAAQAEAEAAKRALSEAQAVAQHARVRAERAEAAAQTALDERTALERECAALRLLAATTSRPAEPVAAPSASALPSIGADDDTLLTAYALVAGHAFALGAMLRKRGYAVGGAL